MPYCMQTCTRELITHALAVMSKCEIGSHLLIVAPTGRPKSTNDVQLSLMLFSVLVKLCWNSRNCRDLDGRDI